MAFIPTVMPRPRLTTPSHPLHSTSSPRKHRMQANAPPPSNSGAPPEPQFTPFDGTLPLLPPWRPPTLESDFEYNATRIIRRESTGPTHPMVRVQSPGFGTLFARLVQKVEGKEGQDVKFWLRPLLLNVWEAERFVDLRGANDVLFDSGAGRVEVLEGELKVKVELNLATTELECVDRFVQDGDQWMRGIQTALMTFLKSLSTES